MGIKFIFHDATNKDLWKYFTAQGWLQIYKPKNATPKWSSKDIWATDFMACVQRLKQSKAGATIYERMEARIDTMHILAVPGVASCFLSAEEIKNRGAPWDALAEFTPLVAIDPVIPFCYLVAQVKPSQAEHADPVPLAVATGLMPPWIVLGHEFGHATQWAYKHQWFCEQLTAGGGVAKIESDNLVAHEHPLCDEASLSRRRAYKDYLAADSVIGSFPFRPKNLVNLPNNVTSAFEKLVENELLVLPSADARSVLEEVKNMLGTLEQPHLPSNKKTKHFGEDQTLEYFNCVIVPRVLNMLGDECRRADIQAQRLIDDARKAREYPYR